jgi:hypothetical protein
VRSDLYTKQFSEEYMRKLFSSGFEHVKIFEEEYKTPSGTVRSSFGVQLEENNDKKTSSSTIQNILIEPLDRCKKTSLEFQCVAFYSKNCSSIFVSLTLI